MGTSQFCVGVGILHLDLLTPDAAADSIAATRGDVGALQMEVLCFLEEGGIFFVIVRAFVKYQVSREDARTPLKTHGM